MQKKIYVWLMLCALIITTSPIKLSAAGKLKKVKIHGYITDVISPTSFEIDEYKITKDESLILDFENKDAGVQFKPEDIRVGTEIEVQGLLDEETDELKATKITVDLERLS